VADTPADRQAHAHIAPESPASAVTRGQFLTLSTVGLGAMIGGLIAVPATAYLLAPVLDEEVFKPAKLGAVDDFPATGDSFEPTAAVFVEDAAQPDTSSRLAWVFNSGGSNEDWLAEDAQFIVFSNTCMHLGCPVVASLSGFACPCHGGQYDKTGSRTAGPPIRPLDRYQWEIREGSELWVTQRWSVDFVGGQLTYYPVKSPGQPVEVPGDGAIADAVPDVLYPNVTYEHGPVPKAQ
jgi:menaquinol-cytochrome c reductase iron-sulfur subunit